MHLTEAVLAPLRARYGEPEPLVWEGDVSADEFALAGGSPERRHDVTFFVFDGRARLALIRKRQYTPGLWRPPGGGVRPEEEFEAGVRREAMEELGIEIEAERLDPLDRREIAEARWGSVEELAGPLRAAMLETGRALWRYRVALHDAALVSLDRI